jgi:hypothetical protein
MYTCLTCWACVGVALQGSILLKCETPGKVLGSGHVVVQLQVRPAGSSWGSCVLLQQPLMHMRHG